MEGMPITRRAVGIDPGHVNAAVIARDGDRLIRARVLVADRLLPPLVLANQQVRRRAWAELVLAVVDEFLGELLVIDGLAAAVAIGVEDVNKPTSHRRGEAQGTRGHIINPEWLIGTGLVAGAVLGRYPTAHVIAPSGNGLNPEACYPEGIRKGRRNLGGETIHARAAWDVAGTALVLARANGRNTTHA